MTTSPAPDPAPTSVSEAYSTTGEAWERGPGRVYDRLAETLVRGSPVPVAGASVLDVGAGTGAGSRAVLAAGAAGVVAADSAWGMLRFDADRRPPAVVADALDLPFRPDGFDLVVAFSSLNHVTDPGAGLREAARVLRPGGGLVVSAYAEDDTHPVKAAAESAAAERGWQPPAGTGPSGRKPSRSSPRSSGRPRPPTRRASRAPRSSRCGSRSRS